MNSTWEQKCIISLSLICLDMCNLEAQVRELEAAGISMLHIDILDGHFSPSMPLGLEAVRQLRAKTKLAFDCHVMTSAPDYFVDELLDIGVQQIVFHLETCDHVDGMLNRIRSKDVRAGVALKPSTPLYSLEYILEKCDAVMLMLINPGYASSKSESQVPYADRKVTELRELIERRSLQTKIVIDGRISNENIRRWGKNLVDIFVAGSTCISRSDIPASIAALNKLRKEVLS